MKINNQGWLESAPHRISPNADDRPAGCVPELIVIHNISLPPGEYGGPWIDALFERRLDTSAHPYFTEIAHLQISAHVLIRRNGSLHQYVSFLCRAWHAGVSFYGLREHCNDFSIGIELEGTDSEPYKDMQYYQLTRLISYLLSTYPTLDRERICGHADIAPRRKTDPGPAFDWGRLHQQLSQHLAIPFIRPETSHSPRFTTNKDAL